MICELCQEEFQPTSKILRKYCYICSPAFSKKDKESYHHRQTSFRQAMKRYGVKLLGGKCSKCGYDKNIAVLTFHHIDPSEKEYNFNDSTMSTTTYKKELQKCILLCANCHLELHNPNGLSEP